MIRLGAHQTRRLLRVKLISITIDKVAAWPRIYLKFINDRDDRDSRLLRRLGRFSTRPSDSSVTREAFPASEHRANGVGMEAKQIGTRSAISEPKFYEVRKTHSDTGLMYVHHVCVPYGDTRPHTHFST